METVSRRDRLLAFTRHGLVDGGEARADSRWLGRRVRSGPVSPIEIGWSIYRRHWNNGYATEAALAALDFALDTLAANRVVALIAKMNVASVRVATKIGMRCEGTSDVYGDTDWLYVCER